MTELSKNEVYAINWFGERGYTVDLKKQWNSKTVFYVRELDWDFELPKGIEDIKAYMPMVEMLMELKQK